MAEEGFNPHSFAALFELYFNRATGRSADNCSMELPFSVVDEPVGGGNFGRVLCLAETIALYASSGQSDGGIDN